MKLLLIPIFVLFAFAAFCQQNDSIVADSLDNRSFAEGWVSSNWAMSLEVGINRFQIQDISEVVETKIGSEFSKNIVNIGWSFSVPSNLNNKYDFDSHIDFDYYISNPVVQELNDSTRYFLRGFNLGFDNCKDLLPDNKNIDILLGAGFNAGWFTFGNWDVTVSDKNNRRNFYRNPYFSPKISNEIRFALFKHLSISLQSEIQFDVTNPKWYSRNKSNESIGGFKTTGYSLRLTLGWIDTD
jgi:hypothetical protein